LIWSANDDLSQGGSGRAAVQDGFTLVSPPTVTGTGVPSGLSSVLS
jgi:hypothetical protein